MRILLVFNITGNEKSKMMTLKVKELVAEPWSYEPHHEFKVDIDSNLFKQIAEYSAEYQTPSKQFNFFLLKLS